MERARRFAELAYSAALGEIVREFDEKRHALRVKFAARGRVAFIEGAKLESEQIAATIKAQLNTLLDGYEVNGVPIDDEVATNIANEVSRSLEASITLPGSSLAELPTGFDVMKFYHMHQVKQMSEFHMHGSEPKLTGGAS